MMSKRTPLYIYVIIITIIALLLWGQSRDGKLLPIVKKQFDFIIPKTDIPPQKNAFIAMAGFNTATPEQMFSEGFKAIELTINNTKKTPFEYNMSFELPKGEKIDEIYQLPCDTLGNNYDCLATVANQAKKIRQLLITQQSFINNYLSLQNYPSFAHVLPSNINTSVPYSYISSISQLLMAKAILDIQAGNIDEGMHFLLTDTKFYRHLLASEQRNLEDTSNFANMLMQHYFVLNRLIHSGISLKPYLKELEPLIAPLSVEERSLVKALENERLYQLIVSTSLAHVAFYTGDTVLGGCYNDSCSFNRYFTLLFYKFNDTLNAIYLDWQPTINFAKADYPFNDTYQDKLLTLQSIEKTHHKMTAYRLYERYGLFLLKNYAGERQKNMLFYSEGYSMWFIKLYMLDNNIKNLRNIINNIY